MPRDFDFPVGAEAWAPLDLNPQQQADRGQHYLQVIGRLRPGVSREQAQQDLVAIAERLGIPVDKAEAAKQGHEVGVNWDDLVPALEAVSRDLSLEVQRTFDYFASTAESERIGRIVLSGGGAKLAGIEDFLASSWGVPVELARPFQGIEHDAAQFADEDPEQIGPVLAVAVGLALRRPGDKPA